MCGRGLCLKVSAVCWVSDGRRILKAVLGVGLVLLQVHGIILLIDYDFYR